MGIPRWLKRDTDVIVDYTKIQVGDAVDNEITRSVMTTAGMGAYSTSLQHCESQVDSA